MNLGVRRAKIRWSVIVWMVGYYVLGYLLTITVILIITANRWDTLHPMSVSAGIVGGMLGGMCVAARWGRRS